MSRVENPSGPPGDFPFEHGDRAALRVLTPDDELWFVGKVSSLGTGGVGVTSVKGETTWAAWPQVVVRSVSDDEWTALHGDGA